MTTAGARARYRPSAHGWQATWSLDSPSVSELLGCFGDVAVFGEAASDELAIPVLVGLGVRELNVSPPAVPRVKAAIRELDTGRCTTLAEEALTLAGADDVRKLVLAMLEADEG